MSTTLSALADDLGRRLNSDPNETFWSSTERTTYLDQGHKYICNYFKWPFLLRQSSQALTMGDQSYDLPSGIQGDKIHTISFSSTTHGITNQILYPETLENYLQRIQNYAVANGIPALYHLDYDSSGNEQIVLDVPPDFTESNTLTTRYFKRATTLSLSTDTIDIPDSMAELPVLYAMSKCKDKEEENRQAQKYMGDLIDYLNLAKLKYTDQITSLPGTFMTPLKNIYPQIY